MSNSDLICKYFSACESKDRKAVELTDDFVFTSPYDYRIDRETYFKRCWPYSEQSPTCEIEKTLERDNEAFVLYDCKTENGGGSRNTEFFTIEGNQIKEIEVYFGSAAREPE
jgi:hypothetical protein